MRKAVAAMMAIKAVAQLTLIAMTVKFLEKEEVNRSIIEEGGGSVFLISVGRVSESFTESWTRRFGIHVGGVDGG